MPDHAKGSYYNNPQYDRPTDDEELIKKFASFLHPNIWPTADLPELEDAFKGMGRIIVDVGRLVAYQVDAYVKKQVPGYPFNESCALENVVDTSLNCKARLLHYFAIPPQHEAEAEPAAASAGAPGEAESAAAAIPHDPFSSWCGW